MYWDWRIAWVSIEICKCDSQFSNSERWKFEYYMYFSGNIATMRFVLYNDWCFELKTYNNHLERISTPLYKAPFRIIELWINHRFVIHSSITTNYNPALKKLIDINAQSTIPPLNSAFIREKRGTLEGHRQHLIIIQHYSSFLNRSLKSQIFVRAE